MARALREIFADFRVVFDRRGVLTRGNAQVNRLATSLAVQEGRMRVAALRAQQMARFQSATVATSGRAARATDVLGGAVKNLVRGFGALGIGLGAASLYRRMRDVVTGTIRARRELDLEARQIGITAGELRTLRYAGESAGIGNEEMTTSLGRLSRAISEARTGNRAARRSFEEIGVSLTDASGNARSTQDVFASVADAVQGTEDPARRVGIAMDLFGRSGRRMIPLLEQGSEGVGQLREEFELLAGRPTEQSIARAREYERAQLRLRTVTTALKGEIATRLLPVLERITEIATRAARWFREMAKNQSAVRTATLALVGVFIASGVAMLIAWGPVIATVLVATAVIVGLSLVIDDLWMTATDPQADTLTRRFLEWTLGADRAREAVELFNQAIRDLRNDAAYLAGLFGIQVGEEGSERAGWNMTGRLQAEEGAVGQIRRAFGGEEPTDVGVARAARIKDLRQERAAEARYQHRADQEDYFQSTFPELAELEQQSQSPLVTVQPQSQFTAVSTSANEIAMYRELREGQGMSVQAPMTVSFTINEATDAAETARLVDRGMRDAQSRQARELRGALGREPAR